MKKRSLKSGVKKIIYIILVIFLICAYLFFKQVQSEYNSITNFEECVAAGYKLTATYPEQCKIPGKTFTNDSQIASADNIAPEIVEHKNTNPKNTSYDIEGQSIILKNGLAIVTNQNETFKSTTTIKYFGNELRVDIDGDSKEDSAFLVTSDNSGSGIFYYLVVAVKKDSGEYIGTNGVLIGDRIAPQTTEFRNGEIVVNYADRKPDEPMIAKPSVGVSRYFKVSNDTLIEIQK